MSEANKLLIVEDDKGLQKQLRWCFEGYELFFSEGREDAIAKLRRHEPPVVLQDLGLPPDAEGVTEGMRCLQEIVALAPHTKVIVVTGNDDTSNAVQAVGAGAWDFYQKPVDTDMLNIVVSRAFRIFELEQENRRLALAQIPSSFENIIACSDNMLKLCRVIEKVAPTDVTALISGESGTGKELIARAIHKLSPRVEGRFVAINCAAIPENLLESELFGHEKGAFTGAVKTSPGKIEMANGGTLLLDEIGDMPLALQAKMLRFLQERTVERVGGREEIPVDVRIICATNQPLEELMGDGRFREDLFYRIGEVTLTAPPLRDRHACIPVLANHFLSRFAESYGADLKGFTSDAMDAIVAWTWPGNVRELENKIKGAVVMAEGKQINTGDLGLPQAGSSVFNLREVRAKAETNAIKEALAANAGNVSKAAEALGVTRPTLYNLMQKNGLGQSGASD